MRCVGTKGSWAGFRKVAIAYLEHSWISSACYSKTGAMSSLWTEAMPMASRQTWILLTLRQLWRAATTKAHLRRCWVSCRTVPKDTMTDLWRWSRGLDASTFDTPSLETTGDSLFAPRYVGSQCTGAPFKRKYARGAPPTVRILLAPPSQSDSPSTQPCPFS